MRSVSVAPGSRIFARAQERVRSSGTPTGKGIAPALVDGDYWIMDCLYGLQQLV